MIKCCNCERCFKDDSELERFEIKPSKYERNSEWANVCPDCKTDEYLVEVKTDD